MKKLTRAHKTKDEKRRLLLTKKNVKQETRIAKYGSDSVAVVAKDMNHRFIAAFMALVFAISCMVVGINFATKAEDETSAESNLVTNKILSFNSETGKYDLTLEAYSKGSTVEKPVALDIALVIDQSGSMITGDMGESYEAVGTSSTKWTVSDATSGEQYYYKVGDKYYPVQAKAGTLYEAQPEMQILDVFGRGHDGDVLRLEWSAFIQLLNTGVSSPAHFDVPTNYYSLDANGKPHKVFALTVGAFLKYNAWLYYYTDAGENVYDVDSIEEWYIGQDNHSVGIKWFDISGNVDTKDLSKTDNQSVFLNSGGTSSEIESYTNWFKTYYRNKSSSNSYKYLRYDSNNDWRGNSTWSTLVGNRYIDFVGQYDSTIDAGNNVRKNYNWFSDGDTVAGDTGVPLYLPVDGYNDIYYIDDDGREVDISNNANGVAYLASDTIYTGKLYKATGLKRYQALQDAVSAFTKAVGQNAAENDVDHRISVIGFAGNMTPGISVENGRYNYSENNKKYDYVNTGLFINGGFRNYKEVTTYTPITYTASSNRHFYINDGTTSSPNYVPVKYYSNGYWYRVGGGYPVIQSSSDSGDTSSTCYRIFYDVISNYNPIDATTYENALVNIRDNDNGYFDTETEINESGYHTFVRDSTNPNGVNDYVDQAIEQFGYYGGTYTSYGITMANQVFANNQIDENENRKRIIIVFTDGEPGANGYDEAIASEALSDGQTSKTTYDAEIYTIGLFKTSPSDDVNTFMNNLSSNGGITKENVYAGSTYGLGTTLDPSKTYYYTDPEDGKTYAVNTNRNGSSSLGWWETADPGVTYYSYLPYEDSSDERSGRTQFYEKSGKNYTAVYSFDTASTYYIKDGNNYYPVKYEYRWYNSDRTIVDPLMNSSEQNSNKVQFFEITNPANTQSANGYYQTAKTAEELNNAFTSITQTISGTQLTSTSILRDVVNTENFDMTGATVSCFTAVGTQATEGGDITFDDETQVPSGSSIQATWDSTTANQLNVTGFDYSKNYIAYGKAANDETGANQGKKLIVKIQGLVPKATGNGLTSNSSAGIYIAGESGEDDTQVATFNSPMLDRQPLTLHVVDTDAKFSAMLGLTAVEGKTADLTKVVMNTGTERTVYSINSSSTATWKSGTGTDVATDGNTVYLEYIRNSSSDMTAADYNLSATFVPVNDDASSYTYSYSLTEEGAKTALTNTAISLGTDNSAKNVYITSVANSRDVTLNLTAGDSPYVDTGYEFKVDVTLSGESITDKLASVNSENSGKATFAVDGDTLMATVTMTMKADGTIDPVTIKVPDGATLTVSHSDYFYTTDPIKYTDTTVSEQTPYEPHAINTATDIYINDVVNDSIESGITDNNTHVSTIFFAAAGAVALTGGAWVGVQLKRRSDEELEQFIDNMNK